MDLINRIDLILDAEKKISHKEIMTYLRSMKGKSDKDVVKGLKKKFNLDDDDARKLLELRF